jgi:prevent-host-death family protein
MAKAKIPRRKGAEEARSRLPELLDAAENGQATVITRHGRPVAALVPIDAYRHRGAQKSLLPLAGSGRSLWGSNSTETIAALRDEWER